MSKIAVLIGWLLVSLNVYGDQPSFDFHKWHIVNSSVYKKELENFKCIEDALFDKHFRLYYKALKTGNVVDIRGYQHFADSVLLLIYELDNLTKGLEVNSKINDFSDRYYARVLFDEMNMYRSGIGDERYSGSIDRIEQFHEQAMVAVIKKAKSIYWEKEKHNV